MYIYNTNNTFLQYYQLANGTHEDYINHNSQKNNKQDYINTFSLLHINSSSNKPHLTLSKPSFPFSGIQIQKISCGDGFSLFLSKQGEVYSVGKGNKCQLGYELPYNESTLVSGVKCKSEVTKIPYFTNNNITIADIFCGSDFSFAYDELGLPYSWGNNTHGQLARKTENEYASTPGEASLLLDFGAPSKFVCGWMHAALLSKIGDVFIWGNPFYDYDKSVKDIKIPSQLQLNTKCIDLSSGFHHLALIGVSNDLFELYTFGMNDFGQCGIKSEDIFVMQPIKVSFPESAPNSINEAVCGAFHTICWMKGDVLYGFGQNDHQQVGNYEAEVLDYPVLVNWGCAKDGKFLKEVICGNAFTYLIKSISKEGVVKDVVEMKEKYRKISI